MLGWESMWTTWVNLYEYILTIQLHYMLLEFSGPNTNHVL